MKSKGRLFEGDTTTDLVILQDRIGKEFPDLDIEDIRLLAREKKNFNTAHLRAYVKGHQIFYFGKDQFKRKIPHVVKARIIKNRAAE